MSRTFATTMPQRRVQQEHSPMGKSDSYSALRGLTGNEGADVNLIWVWNDPENPTQDGGGKAFGLHNPDPAHNGYRWIVTVDGKRVRKMTKAELHRTTWKADDVERWRRGPTLRSERPHTYWDLLGYVKRNGGTVIGELKSWAFGMHPWIMWQLVETAKHHNHAPWFKGLPGRWDAEKCANTIAAGGGYAIIFGKKIDGRAARLREAKKVTADWPVKPTAVW